MSKVTDLITAAAELSEAELKELRSEIERLEKQKRRVLYRINHFSVALTRLEDEEYRKLHRRSVAIQEDGYFLISLYGLLLEDHSRPNLAELYWIFTHLYGDSGRYYDDYKGSFSFPFALDVLKGDLSFSYLLHLHDWRGVLEFSLRKILASEQETDYYVHPPYAEEFSREEINAFIACYYGYLQGRLKALRATGTQPAPFLHRVQSNLILYGCRDGTCFEEQFESEEEFEQAYHDYAAVGS